MKTIQTKVLVSALVASPVYSSTLQRPTIAVSSKESSSQSIKNQSLTFGENFHFSIAYNLSSLTLDLSEPSSLPVTPQSGLYPDQAPASGTFAGGDAHEIRSILGLLFSKSQQLFHIGLGLSHFEIGRSGAQLKKGSSSANLHMNALTTELAIIRKLPRIGYVKGVVALDTMIDGRLRNTYDTASGGSSAILDQRLTSGFRMTIGGEYHFNITSALSVGLQASLFYGTMSFEERSQQSSLYGISYGLLSLLRI